MLEKSLGENDYGDQKDIDSGTRGYIQGPEAIICLRIN